MNDVTPSEQRNTEPGWEQTKQIWRENVWLWITPGLFLGGVIGFLIGISSSADIDHWFINGIWPEAISTCIAIALLYHFDKWRDDRREKSRLRSELLWQVRSRSRDIAVSGIERLRFEKWLEGEEGLLQRADFSSHPPQWQGADLNNANLRAAQLRYAKLENASLMGANFENASLAFSTMCSCKCQGTVLRNTVLSNCDLRNVNFEGADMRFAYLTNSVLDFTRFNMAKVEYACLEGSKMRNADLSGGYFFRARLCGVDLTGAYLLGADLRKAIWQDEMFGPAILPDGSTYTNEQDLDRFIDPDHPALFVPDFIRQYKDYQFKVDCDRGWARQRMSSPPPIFEDLYVPDYIEKELPVELVEQIHLLRKKDKSHKE